MKEQPILFSAPMVRAILEGRKTQTRRVTKTQPEHRWNLLWVDEFGASFCTGNHERSQGCSGDVVMACPYGKPGDRLWVRETCRAEELEDGLDGVRYLADGAFRPIENSQAASDAWANLHAYRNREGATVPPIHMPRWASRLTLEIVSVRVQHVQEISEADALAEGVSQNLMYATHIDIANGAREDFQVFSAVDIFEGLWDSINAKRGFGWDANPLVWVIEFKRVQP